jgi:hypothetical protein
MRARERTSRAELFERWAEFSEAVTKVERFIPIVASLAVILSGCDPGPSYSRIGARLASGEPEVTVAICDDERIEAIDVIDVLEAGEEQVIWRLERTDAAEIADSDSFSFSPFEVPDGFRAVVPKGHASGHSMAVDITFAQGHSTSISWTPDELSSGSYFVSELESPKSIEQLRSARDGFCDN